MTRRTTVADRLHEVLERTPDAVRSRLRLVAGGAVAVGTAAAVGALRQRRAGRVDLPDAATLAAETAVSVHNAAKAAVLAAVRHLDHPTTTAVEDAVAAAVADAAGAGADVTAVVIGAVEGAAEAAALLDLDPRHLARQAARVAIRQARVQGAVAEARVLDALRSLDLDPQ